MIARDLVALRCLGGSSSPQSTAAPATPCTAHFFSIRTDYICPSPDGLGNMFTATVTQDFVVNSAAGLFNK